MRSIGTQSLLLGLFMAVPASLSAEESGDAAVKRTRKQIKMLDGIYKNAIVLVTTHFVEEESDMPAGTAFKKLFEVAKKEGWHEVRLLDATGDPYDAENVAESKFENGSSSRRTVGRGAIARARATRCCCPPDSVSGMRSTRSARPTMSRASLTRLPARSARGKP